jgi:hypothetical protein
MDVIVRAPIAGGIVALAVTLAMEAWAQTQNDSGEIHGLKLGLSAQTMTLNGWGELACGSNGGPTRQELGAWSEFGKCPSEANGLREVAARFDDEDEYVAKALGNPLYAGQRIGTRVAGHPVVLSALFDDGGSLRGIRVVSDPRVSLTERRMAHLLGIAVISRYGTDGWNCTDLAPGEGESPVGGVFIKRRCEKSTPDRDMTIEMHLLRKRGQYDVDPETHEYTRGEFESWTRFELFDPNLHKQ